MSQKTDDQAKPPLNLLSPDKFNRAIFLLGELNKLMVPAMNEMHGLASDLQTAAMQKMAEYATAFRMGEIDESALEAFYRRPFPRLEQARSPGGRVIPGTYSLKIPRFLPMQVGFLESQDDSYNYFRVNRYLDWFGEIPDYIKKELDWKEAPDLKVQGEELVGPRDALIAAVQAHPGLLKEKDGKVLVNKDRYYELLVALIKEGVKPFAEEPVDPADIVERKCDYALRPYQTEIHNLFLKNRHMGIFIPPSTGKCHRKGQKLLMYDGSLKAVENIQIGNELMGPDSLPRLVLSTSRGHGRMVEIQPVRGKPWAVNEDHVLTLVRNGEALVGSAKWLRHECYRKSGEIIDVSVKDWLSWSNNRKWHHKLFHSEGLDFPSTFVPPIEPYFLGVILGDGGLARSSLDVTTADPEVLAVIQAQASSSGVMLREVPAGRAITYIFTRGKDCPRDSRGRPTMHELGIKLRELGLWPIACENRFIPESYLTASRVHRGNLLAGLIDTDGHHETKANESYDYISKSEKLAEGVAFLARSLGLYASVTSCTKTAQNGVSGMYHRVYISGDLTQIPCRVKRKVALSHKSRTNVLRTGFKVIPLPEEEDYYGFTLTGDGRYLLDDFTVTHNTVLGTYEASHLKPPHLFIVPTVMLKEQWEDRIEQHTDLKLGDEVIVEYYTTAIKKYANGFPVKDDKGKVTGHIPFTLKVIDEVHHIGASYYIRMFGIPSKYSLGLSATPYREDSEGEELVFALTGMPVGLSWQYFRDLNLIRNPVCNVWIEKDEKTKERRAIELVTASQKKTIIFCDYIEPGRILAKKLNVPHVYGATKDNLATITAAPVSVVSRVGDEGVSLPDLERIIEYSWNFGSRRQELQRFGRLLHSQMLKQEHHVLMTLNEYAHDKKRFLSIMDKGFKIEIHKEGISDKVIEAKMRRETPRAPRTFSGGPTRQATIAETVPAPEIPSAVTQRLPGITKTLERLETVERVVATTILGNPTNVYSTKELGLATGYSPVTLVHKAHFGKLIDLGLIKEEKGKYRSAL